jgi:hypothetical protein
MDPSWYDSKGVESVEKCASTFLNKTHSGNYYYNILVGGQKYFIQANWKPSAQSCAMS